MKLLLTTWGSRGDMQPLLGLGLGLQRAGHDVLIGATPNFESWVRGHGLPFLPVGFDIYAFSQRETALARSPGNAARRMLQVLRSEIPGSFRQLKDVVPEMDRVVATGLQLAAGSLAEKAGVPFHFGVYVPGILKSRHHTPSLLPWGELPRWLNPLAWWAVETLAERAIGNPVNVERKALGLAPARLADSLFGNDILIAVDPHLSEVPPGIDKRWTQTGAWVLPGTDALPPELESFLRAGPPPSYIGFGSVPSASPEETTRLLVEAVRATGGRGLVSQGWGNLGRAPLPDGFLSIGDVPHDRLFPRVACVIHHGGAGTTQTAARAGVPQLVVPHAADQHYWAHRVQKLGLGPPPIPSTRLTRDTLAAGLAHLGKEHGFQHRARALGERLRAVDGVDRAIRYLEEQEHARRKQ